MIKKVVTQRECSRSILGMVQVLRNATRLSLALFGGLLICLPIHGQVVINEIMYQAPDDLEQLEYIELLNAGSQQVDLSGWKIQEGIEYSFREGATLDTGMFMVLSRDAALFERIYGKQPDGVYDKSLSNSGERITLIDNNGQLVDTVTYGDDTLWSLSADGESASLERICPFIPADSPHHWAPSHLAEAADTVPAGTPGRINDNFSQTLPPVIDQVDFGQNIRSPGASVHLKAHVTGDVSSVKVVYQVVEPGKISEEHVQVMKSDQANTYVATLPGQAANRILRFRITAQNAEGATRTHPHPNALRPTYSTYFKNELDIDQLPVFHFFMVDENDYQAGETYRENHRQRRGGFGFGGPRELNEDDRLRMGAMRRLSDVRQIHLAWSALIQESNAVESMLSLIEPFRQAVNQLNALREELESTREVKAFVQSLDGKIQKIYHRLDQEAKPYLSGQAMRIISELAQSVDHPQERRFSGPLDFIRRVFDIEASLFASTTEQGIGREKIEALVQAHQEAMQKRTAILAQIDTGERIDFRRIIQLLEPERETLSDKVMTLLGRERRAMENRRPSRGRESRSFGGRRGGFGRGPQVSSSHSVQGNAALVVKQPDGELVFFDHVNINQRKSGYKIRLGKGRQLNGMNTINVLYEGDEATILNEHLSYQLYTMSGNAGIQSGYARLMINDQLAGYHLWFEQPNRNFLQRNGINKEGNLYKVIWMGSNRPSQFTPEDKMPNRMDIVGRFEKKTHAHGGYADLVALIEALEEAQGDHDATWNIIQSHFDVDQVINYYAVNMFISHWDGFFNNYFIYHDTEGTGKWSLFPWDQDSTWSQRGGNPDELYEMPLNFGAEGAVPPGVSPRQAEDSGGRRGGRGFGGFSRFRGGPGWWRDGDAISRPLLGNPMFRKKFLHRMRELVRTSFSESAIKDRIQDLDKMVRPEIEHRATQSNGDASSEVQSFEAIMDRLQDHLRQRSAFLRRELSK